MEIKTDERSRRRRLRSAGTTRPNNEAPKEGGKSETALAARMQRAPLDHRKGPGSAVTRYNCHADAGTQRASGVCVEGVSGKQNINDIPVPHTPHPRASSSILHHRPSPIPAASSKPTALAVVPMLAAKLVVLAEGLRASPRSEWYRWCYGGGTTLLGWSGS